jgi:hypothetical protein
MRAALAAVLVPLAAVLVALAAALTTVRDIDRPTATEEKVLFEVCSCNGDQVLRPPRYQRSHSRDVS